MTTVREKYMLVAAKLGLSFVWIFTGLTSLFFMPHEGYTILAQAKITGNFAALCVIGGSLIDIFLGLWLLTNIKLKLCYVLQIIVIVFFTLMLTIIAPEYWLHPFGPITKNIPMTILILYLLVSLPDFCRDES